MLFVTELFWKKQSGSKAVLFAKTFSNPNDNPQVMRLL